MKRENENIRIRTAKIEDARELLEIYAPYVENTAITFEYDVPSPEEFQQRIRRTLKKYPFLVAEQEGEPAGYVYAGPLKERAAYNWAVETTIYIRQDKRGEGIGKILYETLEAVLKEQGILNLYACIAYPEQEDEYLTKDSVRFHEHLGYKIIGKFQNCGYKFHQWYHMVWMEKEIGVHLEEQPEVRSFEKIRDYVMDKIARG